MYQPLLPVLEQSGILVLNCGNTKIEARMKILAESTLTSKEQLTVPKVVRQLLDLHAGSGAWTPKADWLFPADARTHWKTFGQPLPPRKKPGATLGAHQRCLWV